MINKAWLLSVRNSEEKKVTYKRAKAGLDACLSLTVCAISTNYFSEPQFSPLSKEGSITSSTYL